MVGLRVRFLLVVSLVFAASCFGQVRASRGGVGGGSHYGHAGHSYGRGGYVYAYPSYIGGYGGYYGGYYGDYGSGDSQGYSPGYSQAYAPGYAPGYADPSLQGPGPVAAPPVVINQYFGGSPMGGAPEQPDDQNIHMYQQQPPPARYSPDPASDSHTYLIAYKDHSVYTAIAYWVEGNTLHYITSGNTHNQADLNLIDVEFTRKLNSDRSMPFNVPASQ